MKLDVLSLDVPYSQPTDRWTVDALERLGREVRSARKQAGWSQRLLGERAGVDQAVISRLENGLAPGLRASAIARIIRALVGARLAE
jgi:predicted transcriptional regulator